MLPLPTGADEAVIIGLDPGTVNLGVAVLTFDINTFTALSIDATTFNGEKLPGSDTDARIHGDRYRRVRAHRDNLVRIFDRTHPVFIGSESPFYNSKRPNAFEALVEVLGAIRDAVREYSRWRPLLLVDPPTVKRAVGAKGGADKDAIRKALAENPEIMAALVRPLEEMDEHSIDGTAVAWCILQRLKSGVLLQDTRV